MNEFYPLQPFRIRRRELLMKIMRQWPLATLFSGDAAAPQITMLPLVVREAEEHLYLQGHLDANNEHARMIHENATIAFHFRGPDAYASPDLYEDPQLPGWLYVSVHGNGTIAQILEDDKLKSLLIESTNTFGDKEQSFSLDNSDERIDQFIGGIRGFSIQVEKISGIAKLAQDKGPDHARVAAAHLLGKQDAGAVDLIDVLLDPSSCP